MRRVAGLGFGLLKIHVQFISLYERQAALEKALPTVILRRWASQ